MTWVLLKVIAWKYFLLPLWSVLGTPYKSISHLTEYLLGLILLWNPQPMSTLIPRYLDLTCVSKVCSQSDLWRVSVTCLWSHIRKTISHSRFWITVSRHLRYYHFLARLRCTCIHPLGSLKGTSGSCGDNRRLCPQHRPNDPQPCKLSCN